MYIYIYSLIYIIITNKNKCFYYIYLNRKSTQDLKQGYTCTYNIGNFVTSETFYYCMQRTVKYVNMMKSKCQRNFLSASI